MAMDNSACSICGFRGTFKVVESVPPRDNFRCENCNAMLRQRDLAQLVVDEFGQGRFLDLSALVKSGILDNLRIYEAGFRGPIAARLRHLPGYIQSYYWDGVPLGSEHNGIRCEDIRRLSFPSDTFDLMISMEVLEHVFEIEQALLETRRVLKPGAMHIFTIPVRYPLPEHSIVRAVERNGQVVHLEPERYHVAGDGSKSLVVTDFGADFIEQHARAGLKLRIVRRSAPSVPEFQNATFLAQK